MIQTLHGRRKLLEGSCALLIEQRWSRAGNAPSLSSRETLIADELQSLGFLPKVHYSVATDWTKVSDIIAMHYARITGALTVPAEPYLRNGQRINTTVVDKVLRVLGLLQKARMSRPTPIVLAITYSPWHMKFPVSAPPTEEGKGHETELEEMTNNFHLLAEEIAMSASKYGVKARIAAALLDSERFYVQEGNRSWNEAITKKYNLTYEIVHKHFPEAQIIWYARGSVGPAASPTGWAVSRHFTLEERGDGLSCSLYRVPEIEVTRETMRRTFARARAQGIDQVTPWVALASGYRRQTDRFDRWDFNWNYDQIYSWQLGAEINHSWFGAESRSLRFAPWRAARVVVFYPEPMGRVPAWPEHFVAYVRGATGDKRLPVVFPI